MRQPKGEREKREGRRSEEGGEVRRDMGHMVMDSAEKKKTTGETFNDLSPFLRRCYSLGQETVRTHEHKDMIG